MSKTINDNEVMVVRRGKKNPVFTFIGSKKILEQLNKDKKAKKWMKLKLSGIEDVGIFRYNKDLI